MTDEESHLDVMRMWQRRAPVNQDLEYLVVILVGGELEGGDVGGVGGGHRVQRLPGVRPVPPPDPLLMLQQQLHPLHVLLVNGEQQRVPGLDPSLQQNLYQLWVLVDDGDRQSRPAQRVSAVDVEPITITLTLLADNNSF